MGGLTVLKAIRERLPAERLVYLGDTARLPYGTKSADTVTRYALQATRLLMNHDIKLLVIACNTASAVALEPLQKALDPLPVVGVVEPGALAGCEASASGRIAVIATESTVRGGAYLRAINGTCPNADVIQRACPLFVALAEEGWVDGPVVEAVAQRYLQDIFSVEESARPDCLVLGCTHFPVLAPAISRTIGKIAGPSVMLVDSAQTTAVAVENELAARNLQRSEAEPVNPIRFLATDAPDRFARIGGVFLGTPIAADSVDLVDISASNGSG